MIGEGIKQIPSYKCTIPYDKLQKLRAEFWASKTKNKSVWKVIRECCETDSDTAIILLDAAEMECIDGNLRKVILSDTPEFIYKVPNFCITDPLFERDYESLKQEFKNKKEVKIKVVCYYLEKNKNITLDVTSKTPVKTVKKMFADAIGVNFGEVKIRFLFRGQELLDDNLLCYNQVEDMSKIQVVVNQL